MRLRDDASNVGRGDCAGGGRQAQALEAIQDEAPGVAEAPKIEHHEGQFARGP